MRLIGPRSFLLTVCLLMLLSTTLFTSNSFAQHRGPVPGFQGPSIIDTPGHLPKLPPLGRFDPNLPGTPFDPGRKCQQATEGATRQPGLPDEVLAAEITKATADLVIAQPAANLPPIEVGSKPASNDWQPVRDELRHIAEEVRTHLAAITRLDAQLERLRRVRDATVRLGELRVKHVARATSKDLPSPRSFEEYTFAPATCRDPFWNPLFAIDQESFRQTYGDLKFTQYTAEIVLASADRVVRMSNDKKLYEECAAESDHLRGCTAAPPLDGYFFVETHRCVSHGLLPTEPPTFGCIFWDITTPPPSTPAVVSKFHDSVADAGRSAFDAQARHSWARRVLASSDRSPAAELLRRLNDENTSLSAWRAKLMELKTYLDTLFQKITTHQKERDDADVQETQIASQLAILDARITNLNTAFDKEADSLDDIDHKLEVAEAAYNGVMLNCQGKTYKGCADDIAKLSFDRELYEGRKTLMNLRGLRATAQTSQIQLMSERRLAAGAKLSLGGRLITAQTTRGRNDMVLPQERGEYESKESLYQKDNLLDTRLLNENGIDRTDAAHLLELVTTD